jgi:hypothetical protein
LLLLVPTAHQWFSSSSAPPQSPQHFPPSPHCARTSLIRCWTKDLVHIFLPTNTATATAAASSLRSAYVPQQSAVPGVPGAGFLPPPTVLYLLSSRPALAFIPSCSAISPEPNRSELIDEFSCRALPSVIIMISKPSKPRPSPLSSLPPYRHSQHDSDLRERTFHPPTRLLVFSQPC